jgi:hypothetical protein
LYKFKNINNFDYKDFMLAKNLYFKVYVNFFTKTSHKNINKILLYIQKIRKQLIRNIYYLYPEKEAIFLA